LRRASGVLTAKIFATLANVATLLAVVTLAIGTAFGRVPLQDSDAAKAESADYKAWYQANAAYNYLDGIRLAKAYVERDPDGQFVEYLMKWLVKIEPLVESNGELYTAIAKRFSGEATEISDPKTEAIERAGYKDVLDETCCGSFPLKLLEDLIGDGDSVNIRTSSGTSVLMAASVVGNKDKVIAPIKRGADVNARDKHGWTALVFAIWNSQVEVARILLDRGADPNLADDNGRTPLSHAVVAGETRIADLIRMAGGRE
jgi:hypothetical protein